VLIRTRRYALLLGAVLLAHSAAPRLAHRPPSLDPPRLSSASGVRFGRLRPPVHRRHSCAAVAPRPTARARILRHARTTGRTTGGCFVGEDLDGGAALRAGDESRGEQSAGESRAAEAHDRVAPPWISTTRISSGQLSFATACASVTICARPPQHGTSIRRTVMLFGCASRKIPSSFAR